MSSLSGMEKFWHLEDKIYLTLEFAKKMRDEKERFEKEADSMRADFEGMRENISTLEGKIEKLMKERDLFQSKIETMLEAIAAVEPELASFIPK